MDTYNTPRKTTTNNTKIVFNNKTPSPPVLNVLRNGKRLQVSEDVKKQNSVNATIDNAVQTATATEYNSLKVSERSYLTRASKRHISMIDSEKNDDTPNYHLGVNNNFINERVTRQKLKLSLDSLKKSTTDVAITIMASEQKTPIRQWNRDSEKIFPIRDPQNPMQILPLLADTQNPSMLSEDVKVIFEYGISVSKRAIDHLRQSSNFKKMSDERIEEHLNKNIEKTIEQFINNNTNNDIAYCVDIVSKNAEKALQGQQGLFVKKDKIQEGQIVCPFAGVYADKEADFPNEKNYALATSKDEYIISPSPSEQAGYAANTAFKLNDKGELYYNKDGLPQYDSDYINACFVEKWVTFEKDNEDKKIIPMVFIVYLGGNKNHTKNDLIEIRVDYGDYYPQLMRNHTQDIKQQAPNSKLDTQLNNKMPKKQSPRSIRHSGEENMQDLEAYYKNNGNSFSKLSKSNRLYRFVQKQRIWYKEYEQNNINQTSTDRDKIKFDRLKKINIMDSHLRQSKKTFDEYYEIFKEYHTKHGSFNMIHVNLGNNEAQSLSGLRKWYNQYDPSANNSEKDQEKYEKLKIFHNDMIPNADKKYSELLQYKAEHGSFQGIYKKNQALYAFFQIEMCWYKSYDPKVNNSDTDKARYKKCQELGFAECDLKTNEEVKQRNYKNLLEYKKENNGFNRLKVNSKSLHSFYLREKKWFVGYDSIENKTDKDKARYEKLKKLFD